MSKPRIIALGGSFNPPTLAHISILKQAVEELKAEKGIFVPSSDAYVTRKMRRRKTHNHVYTETERLQMLGKICEGIENFMIDTCEYGDDGHGHTYDTLRKIQHKFSEHEIIFLIGADKISILPHWYKKDDLFREFSFGVITRNGIDKQTIHEKLVENPELAPFKDHFYLLGMDRSMENISSSKARELIEKEDWTKLKNILDANIIEFIKKEG